MTMTSKISKTLILSLILIVGIAFTFGFNDAFAATKAQKSTTVRNNAASWAVKIANDNTFTFGKGAEAHKAGCYFCGTNQKKKPKGYEKTYCSNPFVLAAFAHGGNDADMLKDCQAGKAGPFTAKDFKNYKSGKKFKVYQGKSKLAKSKLVKGDVIGKSGKTVFMYVGSGKYVKTVSGTGSGSISVCKLTDSAYKNMDFVARYTLK